MTLVQQIQEKVGVKQDGVVGPKTRRAIADKLGITRDSIKDIQTSVGVTVDGELGPITVSAIANKLGIAQPVIVSGNPIIDVATKEFLSNIREVTRNQGPGLKKYWLSTWYPDGYEDKQPWCAAFVCYCCQQSGKFTESTRPKTPAAFGFETWADDHPTVVKIRRKPSSVKKGNIVVYSYSHIGIATSDSDSNGNFHTIEGNTGDASDREGDGVYKKVRNISTVRSTITLLV